MTPLERNRRRLARLRHAQRLAAIKVRQSITFHPSINPAHPRLHGIHLWRRSGSDWQNN